MQHIREYTRTRNGRTQIVKASVRGTSRNLVCPVCGIAFVAKGLRTRRKFCSRACYIVDWKGRIPGWNKGGHPRQRVWNKGLTKENNSIVLQYSLSMAKRVREQFASGERKGTPKSPETRHKMALGKMGDKNPMRIYPHLREKSREVAIRVTLKMGWKSTNIERKLWEELDRLGVTYLKNHSLRHYTIPDAYITATKTCIYADGDYWHNLPNWKERDARVNAWLVENGYRYFRFWEHEILAPDFPTKLKMIL